MSVFGPFAFPIYIACDHAGYYKKKFILALLSKQGHSVEDLGPDSTAPVDYPDYAYKMAEKMKNQPDAKGILLCGTGIGISMAANRFPHIRAALCTNRSAVSLARAHNNANVLVLSARTVTKSRARCYVQLFLHTPFEGGRHCQRVAKLSTPKI